MVAFCGKKYDVVYAEWCDISFGEDKVFLNKKLDIDKWYKKQAKELFLAKTMQNEIEKYRRKKEDPNDKNLARYAGILSSMILPALHWEIPISYYEPERMVNYFAVQPLQLLMEM